MTDLLNRGTASPPSKINAAPSLQTTCVLILNYSGRSELEICLASLELDAAKHGYHVVVADNGSTDDSVEWTRVHHPWVRILEHGRNLGFACGVNHALKSLSFQYFALLNNDTKVSPGWLVPLLDRLVEAEDIAAVQSRIMLMKRPHLIQSAGGGVTSDGSGFDTGYLRWFRPPFDRAREVPFVSAGAALFRSRAWKAVGEFDPEFFMYHEDVDWGWRAWLSGFRLMYEPSSVVFHEMSVTTSKVFGRSARELMGQRHRIRSVMKLHNAQNALPLIARFIVTRDFRRWRRILTSCAWNLRRLRSTLSLRRSTQRSRPQASYWMLAEKQVAVPGLPVCERVATWESVAEAATAARAQRRKILAGKNDESFLGLGWYPAQPLPDTGPELEFTRMMADEAELFGIVDSNCSTLHLRLSGAEEAMFTGLSRVSLQLRPLEQMTQESVCEVVKLFRLERERNWIELQISFPPRQRSHVFLLTLRTSFSRERDHDGQGVRPTGFLFFGYSKGPFETEPAESTGKSS